MLSSHSKKVKENIVIILLIEPPQKKKSTYFTRPLAPSAMESTVLPSMRMYTSEPSNPTQKLQKANVKRE